MDGEAWEAAVHGVAKSRTRLSDFTSLSPYIKYDSLYSTVNSHSLSISCVVFCIHQVSLMDYLEEGE